MRAASSSDVPNRSPCSSSNSRWRSFRVGALFGTLLACSQPPAPKASPAPLGPASRLPAPAAASTQVPAPEPVASNSAPTSAPAAESGVPCGELNCQRFASPAAAFARVLSSTPRVLAIGEAHAQKGSERVASTTRRFAEQLLPLLRGRATDLVIELLTPSGRCGESEQRVAEAQAPVTKPQAETNQSDFVKLGHAAKSLGIRPHALPLSCEAAAKIAAAKERDIEVLLETVSDSTRNVVESLLSAAPPETPSAVGALLLTYGGIVHNDILPRPGREGWSFGPALQQTTHGGYIELDLIVPEYVRDTETWRALPWYAAYAKRPAGDGTWLYSPSPQSFVLIFPASH